MDISSAFPSNYLKCADLGGREVVVTISGVQLEDMGDDREKAVIYFHGKKKGLVCNRTNAETIAEAYGPETDSWIDKPILLYPTKTNFKGQMTPCIRVRVQRAQPARPAPKSEAVVPNPQPAAPQVADMVEDDVPF